MSGDLAGQARQLAGMMTRIAGWPPATFWNSTPAEIEAILAAYKAPEEAPPSRTQIDAMMERDVNGR